MAKEQGRSISDFTKEEWERADVYSFSMVCFEIVTGRLPFDGELENTRVGRVKVCWSCYSVFIFMWYISSKLSNLIIIIPMA